MYSDAQLREFLEREPIDRLLREAVGLRDEGHGDRISFSKKVFIPLTRLCRDACHYCTFAKRPREIARPYLTPAEVLRIARTGEQAGCTEALFTLGDKPELRYKAAREGLERLGFATTIEYLAAMCELVLRETSLLPHVNPGVMTHAEIERLRAVSVSQGLMLESASERLCGRGQVHFGSPDKDPAVRLATIRAAGQLAVPFTSGILIGIGETRSERFESLLALRRLHTKYGHLQEIIVQNFRAKAGTKLAGALEPTLEDLCWTVATARLVFGPHMNIQAPPNLSGSEYPALIAAGINDWGGISPITPDHVNPEAPWPAIEALRRHTERMGKILVARLPAYPPYCLHSSRWIDAALRPNVLRAMDAEGFARADRWAVGVADCMPPSLRQPAALSRHPAAMRVVQGLEKARAGVELSESEIEVLFQARGPAFEAVCSAADEIRRSSVGDLVRYTVNRNINYTNVCGFRCRFCAFSKGKASSGLRGTPYDLDLEEVARRAREAWARGATEVCMQGGIHPDYTGETYLALLRAVKVAVPDIHVHAFSPLEVTHGAATLGITLDAFLSRLRDAGLGTLPGTAAEVLDDEVRAVICPDKLTSSDWLNVIERAHRASLRTTATIMFGHVDGPRHWARHLLAIRRLQQRTGGFTEFVPLPFVHMEAPIYHSGAARRGPTFRESVLMHAIARLTLHPLIPNIQVSWVKMGPEGVRACLQAGANDLGGTLMNETISRAAGTQHGQEMPPGAMDRLIASVGRTPQQRTTLYAPVSDERTRTSYRAVPLAPLVLTAATRYARAASTGAHAIANPTPSGGP